MKSYEKALWNVPKDKGNPLPQGERGGNFGEYALQRKEEKDEEMDDD